MQMQAPVQKAASAQKNTAQYYKDVMAAKKCINNVKKQAKVYKIEDCMNELQDFFNLLNPYSSQKYTYQVPQMGGQAKSGPAFASATQEAIRICEDAASELDFKKIENALM